MASNKLTPFQRRVLEHVRDNGAVPVYITAEPARRASVNAMRLNGWFETLAGRTVLTQRGRLLVEGKCACGCGSKAR